MESFYLCCNLLRRSSKTPSGFAFWARKNIISSESDLSISFIFTYVSTRLHTAHTYFINFLDSQWLGLGGAGAGRAGQSICIKGTFFIILLSQFTRKWSFGKNSQTLTIFVICNVIRVYSNTKQT